MNHHTDFIDAGYKVFGLHGILPSGLCACGWDKCNAPGKHPQAANWQHTPHWSDDQLETLEQMGQFDTGYGVLVDGLLVVDVDARNGGVQSYNKLLELVPEVAGAGLIVETGSGGGSQHLYFALPEPVSLMQSLPNLKGIDFKSSGFVVGPGSIHASKRSYNAVVGTAYDIGPAPAALVALLFRAGTHRAKIDAQWVDISDDELLDMLRHIPNQGGIDYEQWIRIGMALHHATSGTGYELWRGWSATSAKHDETHMEHKWHSFGKSANPVTIGTLVHHAQQNGWQRPVTFTADWHPEEAAQVDGLDTAGIDLLRPPGFAGELTAWINSQSIFPRETLAVSAALMAISNCGGMRYTDPLDNGAFNLFCFGVADSSTGKEAILQAHNDLIRAAGISPALVGGIKSEQEIYRNLIRHQAAFYSIDELGEHLAKIVGSKSRGGAVYLEGVIGALMSIYSKSNSFVAVTGDLKEQIKQDLMGEQKRTQKAIDDGEKNLEHRLERIQEQLQTVDMGIESPFLSIFGLTTPDRFDKLMDYDMAVNGFMGRALIFRELEGNPRIKPREHRTRPPVPDRIKYTLAALYAPGYTIETGARVERYGDKSPIQTTQDAAEALDLVGELFWQMADKHKDETGLHPIPRRGYELTAKVSAVLAMPSGLRTLEHVRWAYALVKRDIDGKMRVAYSNCAPQAQDALSSKIMSMVTGEHGETLGAIQRGCRSYAPADVEKALERMVDAGALVKRESTGRGRPTVRYYVCDKND
jgi:hypothetical protein